MPAIMDDPASAAIHRVSGPTPYPDPNSPALPNSIRPRQVTLRDRQTVATLVPFASKDQVPASLLAYLSDQFAKEIEGGDTYPMIEPMPLDKFSSYWFQNMGAIMLLGTYDSASDVVEGKDWSVECLGSFYIKPNYPGRSSHVSNGGFLVTSAARNRGVGRLMGETYLDWAPKLGYSYSVFNLVYETNVASCKIWDGLGFKRIGRVKGCGNLKSYPDRLVDAIIYGRELGTDTSGEADPLLVSEERFDKIKFYLKHGRYPNGSNRAEKSRLRSAATHYKLLENDKLMLKDKEVISDPIQQMDIARRVHEVGHAGINKTTAIIAERYHWSRIKETVSDVIRTCVECKDLGKAPSVPASNTPQRPLDDGTLSNDDTSLAFTHQHAVVPVTRRMESHHEMLAIHQPSAATHGSGSAPQFGNPHDISSLLNPAQQDTHDDLPVPHSLLHDNPHHEHHRHDPSVGLGALPDDPSTMYNPIDPRIISDMSPAVREPAHSIFQPFRPHGPSIAHHGPQHPQHTYAGDGDFTIHHTHSSGGSTDPFHVMLHEPENATHHSPPGSDKASEHNQGQGAVDRDLDMLIEHDEDPDLDVDVSSLDGVVEDRRRSHEDAEASGDMSKGQSSKKRRHFFDAVFEPPG